MKDFNKEEVLSLYFLLSDMDSLPIYLDSAMLKLEEDIFENFNVKEIEEFRVIFRDKDKN
ncbi:MAG: hypothetical protein OCD02_20570 [Spirochaetaceae bacterium]